MRVIAGDAGRLPLDAPKSLARPSTDRLREALFSILGNRVDGARVLDLFAGSGSLGIEALSRGADSAVFIDQDRRAIQAVEANLKRTRLAARATVLTQEIFSWCRRNREVFDLILADPPYHKHESDRNLACDLLALPEFANGLAADGLVVIETGSEASPTSESAWERVDTRRYGGSHLHFFEKRA